MAAQAFMCKPFPLTLRLLHLEAEFLKFVQIAFAQRRKTLINNLVGIYGYNKSELIEKFKKELLSIDLRAETLDCNELFDLFNKIKR